MMRNKLQYSGKKEHFQKLRILFYENFEEVKKDKNLSCVSKTYKILNLRLKFELKKLKTLYNSY